MAAVTDTKTGIITGCEVGSPEYLHEKAHIEFANSNFGMNLLYWDEIIWRADIIFIVLCLIGIDFFKWFALIGIFINLGIFVFEEYYCNYKAQNEKEIKE